MKQVKLNGQFIAQGNNYGPVEGWISVSRPRVVVKDAGRTIAFFNAYSADAAGIEDLVSRCQKYPATAEIKLYQNKILIGTIEEA